MKPTAFRLFTYAVLVSMAVSACECDRRGPAQRSYGEIGLLYTDEAGTTLVASSEVTYDFGKEFMGKKRELSIRVRNVAKGTLTLATMEKIEGDFVNISGHEDGTPPVFTIDFKANQAVESGEDVEIVATFAPPEQTDPQDPARKTFDHSVKLQMGATNTEPGKETALITLKGTAVSGVCEIEDELNFGAVAIGDKYTRAIEVDNPTQLPAKLFVGDIYGGDNDWKAFSFSPDSPRGTVEMPPDAKKRISITFEPKDARPTSPYRAYVKMRTSEQCPDVIVKLIGKGVTQVLTWEPATLDFGNIPPGIEFRKELTFVNEGHLDANLTGIRALLAGDYKVVPEADADPTKLSVSANGGRKTISIAFKPTGLGKKDTQLIFNTNLPRQTTGAVGLKGYGGGPDIQVNPSPTLNFGKVAYFAGAQAFQTRKLTVLNVGTPGDPAKPESEASLKLGKADPSGKHVAPYFELKLLDTTQPGEITVVSPASYKEDLGLVAKAGQNMADFIVQVTPASLGQKAAEITIFSNDPDEAEVKLVVMAEAVSLPPCSYSVSPLSLNFGLVSPPNYKDLPVTITNKGQNPGEICLLSNLDIASGSSQWFTLPAGPIASRELQPKEVLTVTVRVWPKQMPSNQQKFEAIKGNLEFFMSSPNSPQALVTLDASVAAGCLTIAPDELNFGTVQKGCYSSYRTFTVYNTCDSPVTIHSVGLQAAGGEPAGGPNCPGTAPCPEFFITASTPAIPTGGLVFKNTDPPMTFQGRYKPLDFGSDTGAIAINAVQGTQNVTYVVTLEGKGDANGINTDVFTQDSKPKADILITIDNSCSMAGFQQSLANNFGSFIKYAQSAQVDYHIGVTTTDDDAGGQQGRLVTGAGHLETVLTPQTQDVENKFKAKVNVGTSGSASETALSPSLKALTAPLITSTNAGFLRQDANLAVVVVTDTFDHSPNPVTFYYNAFLTVKGFKNSNAFTFNAIGGFNPTPPAGCSYDERGDDGQYRQLVTLTNGVKEEICTPDWSKSLEGLGKTAFGFRTNFFLNAAPDLTGGKKIAVQIDGVDIPPVDIRNATVWTYDGAANSVNFEPMYVPEPGQTMTITYNVACITN